MTSHDSDDRLQTILAAYLAAEESAPDSNQMHKGDQASLLLDQAYTVREFDSCLNARSN